MQRRKQNSPIVEAAEKAASALEGFDYGVAPEDFVFYELDRLIEEDRASFDDSDFRTLIDEGVRAHIQENLPVRARLAEILRLQPATPEVRAVIARVIEALEDLESDLCNVAVVVRSYTAYLFRSLEALEPADGEDRIAAAADLLFESIGDRDAAETALTLLCASPSPVSARVLAHAISEPLLDEDLETRAFDALKTFWPLPRHYMLYNLQGHPHEDIPLRWFQLFVEVDEETAVDLSLEELRAHGDRPEYREDLVALLDVLHSCRDPEMEDKILGAINSAATETAVRSLLEEFLRTHSHVSSSGGPTPWTQRTRLRDLNRKYLAAAKLFDAGKRVEAGKALEKILAADPNDALAQMLTGILEKAKG